MEKYLLDNDFLDKLIDEFHNSEAFKYFVKDKDQIIDQLSRVDQYLELQKDIDKSKRIYGQDGEIIKKLCPCCKRYLDIIFFKKRKTSPDGYREYCEGCINYSLQ